MEAITVHEVDINKLTSPLSRSNEKTVYCLCCTSVSITPSVNTDRSWYCPGESIAISTEAENHSNRNVRVIRASLMLVESYINRANGYEK